MSEDGDLKPRAHDDEALSGQSDKSDKSDLSDQSDFVATPGDGLGPPRGVMRDLRMLDGAAFDAILPRLDPAEGAMITAWQAVRAPAHALARLQGGVMVVAPDFLNYARLLSTGQARAMLELPGPGSLARALSAGVRAGLGVITRPLALARQDFWTVAEVLLRYDLALLPAHLAGAPRLLHANLSDFAFAFERRDFARRATALLGAGGGVFTQQPAMAASCLARWGVAPGVMAFLCPPGHDDMNDLLADMSAAQVFARTRFVADVSNLTPDLQSVEELAELLPKEVGALLFAPPVVAAVAVEFSPADTSSE